MFECPIGRKIVKIWNCQFWANSGDRPWIHSNQMGKWIKSKDDRLNSPKSGIWNFSWFSNVELVEKLWNFETATFERIKPIVLGFFRISWESGSNPRTIGLIRSKVAFEFFWYFRMSNRVALIFSQTFSFANGQRWGAIFSDGPPLTWGPYLATDGRTRT